MDSSKTVTASLYLRTEYTYDYAGRRISSWLPTNNTGLIRLSPFSPCCGRVRALARTYLIETRSGFSR
jgi:hypothetical protein